MDGDETMTLADYLSVVRRRLWIIVLAAVLGAVAGGAYLALAQPSYESTARLVLRQVSDSPEAVGGGAVTAATLTATQKSILRSDEVTRRAANELDDGTTMSGLRDASTVEVVPDSLTLDVTYQSDKPARAQAGAQALVDSYLDVRTDQEESRKAEKVDALDEQRSNLDKLIENTTEQLEGIDPQGGQGTGSVLNARLTSQLAQQSKTLADLSAWEALDVTPGYVVTPASLPDASGALTAGVVLIGAVAVATILGFLVALVYDSADPKLRSAQDLQQVVHPSPIDMIADQNGGAGGPRAWLGRSHRGRSPGEISQVGSPEAENYRRLALRLDGGPGPWPRYLLVTSAGANLAEEVAANLSVALGREGARTLLIWSNPRDDTLDAYFSVPPGPGLGEVLAESVKIEDAVLEIPGCPGLSLLPVGSRDEAREGLHRFSSLKKALADPDRVHFDEVVMIAPSATEFADALALAPQADGVLVAAELRLTDRNALAATLEGLRLVDAHLAGVVVLR